MAFFLVMYGWISLTCNNHMVYPADTVLACVVSSSMDVMLTIYVGACSKLIGSAGLLARLNLQSQLRHETFPAHVE